VFAYSATTPQRGKTARTAQQSGQPRNAGG
jgi:hypothetical protein